MLTMYKEYEIDEFITNVLGDDVADATQSCRELEAILSNDDYAAHHEEIEEALEDAYEKWGDRNCNNWAGTAD